jgi:hypothetical protein
MAAIRLDAVFKQFPSGLLVCALLVASGLVWAVMFFGPLAHLSRLAGGASPFDIRPMGYSHDEAYAFLNARHVRNFVDRNVRRQIWRGIGRIGFSIDHAGPSAFLKDTPMHFLIYMLHGRVNRTH